MKFLLISDKIVKMLLEKVERMGVERKGYSRIGELIGQNVFVKF